MLKALGLILCGAMLFGCGKKDESTVSILNYELKSGVFSSPLSFGEVGIGESKVLSVKLSNIGDETLVGPLVVDNNFSLIYQSSSCIELAPNQSCVFKIMFNAQGKIVGSSYSGNLNFDNASIALSASIAPEASVVNSSLVDFMTGPSVVSNLSLGSLSYKQTVIKSIRIKNKGSSPVLSNVSVSSFYLAYDNCSGKTILPNNSCEVKVGIKGSGLGGLISGSLNYAGESLPLSAQVVAIEGTTGEGVTTLTSDLIFLRNNNVVSSQISDNVLVSRVKQYVLYIKNIGDGKTAPVTASMSNSDFQIVFNQCVSIQLESGSHCQVRIIFDPRGKSEGSYSSILSIGTKSLNIQAQVVSSLANSSSVFWDNSVGYTNLADGGITTSATRGGNTYFIVGSSSSALMGDFELIFTYQGVPQHDSVMGVAFDALGTSNSSGHVGYGGGTSTNLHINGSAVGVFPWSTGNQVFKISRVGTSLYFYINQILIYTANNMAGTYYPIVSLKPGEVILSTQIIQPSFDTSGLKFSETLKSSSLSVGNGGQLLSGNGAPVISWGYLNTKLPTSGKYYIEYEVLYHQGSQMYIGGNFLNTNPSIFYNGGWPFASEGSFIYNRRDEMGVYVNYSLSYYTSLWGMGNKVGIAIDFDAKKYWVGVDGNFGSGQNPSSGLGGAGFSAISGYSHFYPAIGIQTGVVKIMQTPSYLPSGFNLAPANN